MNGKIQNITIDGRICSMYLPTGYLLNGIHYPVVYVNGGDEINISEIMNGIEPHFSDDCREFLLLSVNSENWNYDYSPWPAPALDKKSDPFGGGITKSLNFLIQNVKTYVDNHYRTKPEPENTALVGYSLGGLPALYSLYTCKIFGKIGSMSGSLWFDGWTEFMESNKPLNTSVSIYLSLGKKEELSRNQRIAKVGDCTRKSFEILEKQLSDTGKIKLEWNNGGHFTEITERFQRAILWLMQE